jgi:hypothetical protein
MVFLKSYSTQPCLHAVGNQIMTLKLIIGFLLSTLLLVASEYIFLEEFFSAKRPVVLAACLVGIAGAAMCFIYFFNRYHNALKES